MQIYHVVAVNVSNECFWAVEKCAAGCRIPASKFSDAPGSDLTGHA